MTTYGVTDTGFLRPSMDVIRAAIEAKWHAAFGASIDTSESTPDGQIINIFAERESLVWQVAEQVYGMMDPDKATGAALDALCLVTGTFREAATRSAVTCTLTGDVGTVVPQGSQTKTTSTSVVFAAQENGSLVALTTWIALTAYVVGDRRTNSGNAYVCITSGTSAGAGGPVTTTADETDGTVHWRYMGAGAGSDDVLFAAVDTGPTIAVSGDLNVIDTQVAGWSGVINLVDAVPGTNRTSDQGLRLLREFELAASGDSPVPAIRRAISRVTGVTNVTVFYNNTDVTDGDSIPPHSVEVMVQGGADQDIWDALFRAVAGGIGYKGTEVGTTTDTEGTTHTIKLSRVTPINIYTDVFVEVDPESFPDDGITQIKAAITAFGLLQKSGKNAVANSIGAQAFEVDGVNDVTEVRVYTDVIGTASAWLPTTGYVATVGARSVVTNGGRAYICITSGTSAGSGGPTGTSTDITDGTVHWRCLTASVQVSTRELAVFDTSRIDVTTTNGTP